MQIVNTPPRRAWMDETRDGMANRCLPLLIANQAGWSLLNDGWFTATWNGGVRPEDLAIELGDPAPAEAPISHFGHGILTWTLPFLFRTAAGWNLLARGPANAPIDGASALEGLIESDWAYTPFTMNWQLTRPGHSVTFQPGDTICMIVPQRRGDLERFRVESQGLESFPDLRRKYEAWRDKRNAFNADPRNGSNWQKHYFQGIMPSGETAPDHQLKLRLCPFSRSEP